MNPIEFRVAALERWRDKVDEERGVIMGELGEVKGMLSAVSEQLSEQLQGISARLDERPSRVEMEAFQKKQRHSIFPQITQMEVEGPWNMKFRLFGVSGIVIVIAIAVIAAVVLKLLGK